MDEPTVHNASKVLNVSKLLEHSEQEYRILQGVWDLRLGYEEFFQSPLFPVALSIIAYFSLALPFCAVDILCSEQEWYNKYKIQPNKRVTWPLIYETLHLTFWNHVLLILPASIAQWIWVPITPLPDQAPTLFEFFWHQIACTFIFDFQYYVWHLTHHKIRFLYRHIHAVHHRYHSPFVWVTQYLHPWELITIGFLTTTNTWFFNSHPLTVWSYMLVAIILSVEAHMGFDIPFLPYNWDPTGILGGSPKHDMHHQKPLTNYQPFFNHLDKLFGSYCPAMSAGGIKSKALVEWERKMKDCKKNF